MTSAEAAGSSAEPAPRLLLVEDEESIGSLVSAYLEQGGYGVTWLRTGEDALLQLERIRPRLVILDVGLPGRTASRSARRSAAARTSRS